LTTDSLRGEVALVTGASRGIGRQVAHALALAGAEVVLAARSLEGLQRVAAEIGENAGTARAIELDVADEQSVERASTSLLGDYGKISILVNNAGITRDNLLLRMKPQDWQLVIETNLTGTYRLSRAFLPGMLRARHGRIINITSVVAQTGNAGQANYTASKAGIEGFTRSLAREIASRQVTVNCVAPGLIETDMTRELEPATRDKLLAQIPMQRWGEPADVAAAVVFLSGPGASYITGATLHVNGGMYM
jgi:3-oxoacyl-[acyl-carrier protein] reductase